MHLIPLQHHDLLMLNLQVCGQRNGTREFVRLRPNRRCSHFPAGSLYAQSCSTTLPWRTTLSLRYETTHAHICSRVKCMSWFIVHCCVSGGAEWSAQHHHQPAGSSSWGRCSHQQTGLCHVHISAVCLQIGIHEVWNHIHRECIDSSAGRCAAFKIGHLWCFPFISQDAASSRLRPLSGHVSILWRQSDPER